MAFEVGQVQCSWLANRVARDLRIPGDCQRHVFREFDEHCGGADEQRVAGELIQSHPLILALISKLAAKK